MALPLAEAFTARALGTLWDRYEQSLGLPPYLGRSFFGTDKQMGLELRHIVGESGLPVALKGSAFDAQAPLRHPIGFGDIQNEMPFFRESYMVTEKEEQEYMNYMSSENSALANQVLKEISKKPLDLIRGADVVPERMIWQLLAPTDGIPKIDVVVDGREKYTIHYTTDDGTKYKASNFVTVEDLWSDPTTAKPIADVVALQKQAQKKGKRITQFAMNSETWQMFCDAQDTKKQVQGILAYQNGIMLDESEVKRFMLSRYSATFYIYDSLYLDENGESQYFIPTGMVTAIEGSVNQLGIVTYGTTPEERSGNLANGTLSIVNTGVSVYTYTTEHPINTHCVVSEIVLPTYENMYSVFVMKVTA